MQSQASYFLKGQVQNVNNEQTVRQTAVLFN